MNILIPFYIDNTTITQEQREDLYQRCIAAGAGVWVALEAAGRTWFGVDEDFDIVSWDDESNFTMDGVPYTTYDQVWKYLGEECPEAPAQYWLLTVLYNNDGFYQKIYKGSIVDFLLGSGNEANDLVITHSVELTEGEYKRLDALVNNDG